MLIVGPASPCELIGRSPSGPGGLRVSTSAPWSRDCLRPVPADHARRPASDAGHLHRSPPLHASTTGTGGTVALTGRTSSSTWTSSTRCDVDRPDRRGSAFTSLRPRAGHRRRQATSPSPGSRAAPRARRTGRRTAATPPAPRTGSTARCWTTARRSSGQVDLADDRVTCSSSPTARRSPGRDPTGKDAHAALNAAPTGHAPEVLATSRRDPHRDTGGAVRRTSGYRAPSGTGRGSAAAVPPGRQLRPPLRSIAPVAGGLVHGPAIAARSG